MLWAHYRQRAKSEQKGKCWSWILMGIQKKTYHHQPQLARWMGWRKASLSEYFLFQISGIPFVFTMVTAPSCQSLRFRTSDQAKALYLAPLKACYTIVKRNCCLSIVIWGLQRVCHLSLSSRHFVRKRCETGSKPSEHWERWLGPEWSGQEKSKIGQE